MNWKTLAKWGTRKVHQSLARRPRRLWAEWLEHRRLLAAMVRSGTGATPLDLEPTVALFRGDLGDPVNGATLGSLAAGRREINWDGVADDLSAPNYLPGDFFNATSPRGVEFETVGIGFSVSAKAGNPTSTEVRFGDIDPSYTAQFATFSAERLFTPIGSNVMDVRFFVPGTDLPATVRGFGSVFADVDNPGSTTIELFDAGGVALGSPLIVEVLDDGLSFLGVSFDAGERIARVRITSGSVALGPGVVDGGTDDVVVMDDFIYAEPQPLGNLFAVDATNQLLRFNAEAPGAIVTTTAITGLQSGEDILGIDFRPATGQLYALGSTNQLYTINTATGAATAVGQSLSVPLSGGAFGFDFNSVVDRIRVVSDAEQNLRIHPDTGELLAEDTPLFPAGSVVAAAYTNSHPGATVTTLFGIDADSDSLVRQGGPDGTPSPNEGVITSIGPLGVNADAALGFDIASGSNIAYAAMTVDNVSHLYRIDLATGAATDLGVLAVVAPIRGLAVAQAPQVTIGDVEIVEGDVGSAGAVFTVTLSAVSPTPVTVDFTTMDDTAVAGVDYDAANGTLVFQPGQTTAQITVQVRGDLLQNGNRTFLIVLSNLSTNADLVIGEAVGTIEDNENVAPVAGDDTGAATEDAILTVDAPGVLSNDTDGNADPLTVSDAATTSTMGASVTVNPDGSYTYDPTASTALQSLAEAETVVDTFDYTIDDGNGATDTATVSVTVTGVNDAPVAVDDMDAAFNVAEDQLRAFAAAELLANDTDVDASDTLTISAVSAISARGATVTLNLDGSVTYDPTAAAELNALSAGQTVDDTFEYTVSDGHGGVDTAIVTIVVTGVNDAPQATADSADALVGEVLVIPAANLLGNDTDADQQDVLVIATVDAASAKGAVVTLNGDGSVSYDPTGVAEFNALLPGQSTTDTFSYTISDGQGGASSAVVTVTVTRENNAPTAVADTGAATANVVLDAPAPGVLANDTDPDTGDTLSTVAETITSTLGATVTINADGSYSYDPTTADALKALADGETADDTFSYTLRDLVGATAVGTVTITVTGVNDAPQAVDDSGATTEDEILSALPGALLQNDIDPDGDTLEAVVATFDTAKGAKVGILANGGYFYDPRDSVPLQSLRTGETTTDTFTYTVTDPDGLMSTATVTVTVTGVNDPPTAVNDTGATNEDAVLNVAAPGLLGNDTDPDAGDPLTAVVATITSQFGAAVTINADGSYSYDPTAAAVLRTLNDGQTQDDTFSYTMRDEAGVESTATVTITVSGVTDTQFLPEMTIANASIAEGNSGQAVLEFTVTLSHASLQTITVNFATADGTATIADNDFAAASGMLTFTPQTLTQTIQVNINGDTAIEQDETFAVNLTDAVNTSSATATATGTIEDDDNQPPTAVADNGATNEDTVFTATTSVLANDTDPESHPLTITAGPVTSVQGAAVTINADGTYSYDPTAAAALQALAAGATIDDIFEYTVTDSFGGAAIGVVTITVTGINDAPTADDDAFAATEDDVLTIAAPGVLANDTDVDTGDTLTLSTAPTSMLGAAVTLNADGSFTYDPTGAAALQQLAVGATMDDTFTYTVDDGKGGTDTATVTITVTGVNDLPTAVADDYDANEDAVLNVDSAAGLLANDTDVEPGSVLTSTTGTFTSQLGATVTINADGSFSYDPTNSATLRTLGVGQTVDDTFSYTLNDDDGGQATGTATVTVTGTADGPLPELSIADVALDEGQSGDTVFTFTVSLSFASVSEVTVNFATQDGTAIAGTDYAAANGTLTFAPGVTAQTIQVTIAGDTIFEQNETFIVKLSSPSGATLADDEATGTIQNDDSQPTISIADANVDEGDSGPATLTFTVTLSNASSEFVTVQFATTAVTATAVDDFTAANGVVEFLPGETTKQIMIFVNGDTVVEPDETLLVTLSNANGGTIADAEATGTINDDDVLPTLSVADASVNEIDSGEVDLIFTVTLSEAQSTEVTVAFATADGTALATSDYTQNAGTLTFAVGETSKTIVVKVLGDTLDEIDEMLTLVLSNPTGATLTDGEATGTIVDNDNPPTISISDRTVIEGNSGTVDATFTVTLSAPSSKTITVNYTTANDTATAGSDFTTATGTLTFAPGETMQTFVVQVNGDTTPELDERFFVTLSGEVNATLADGQGEGTITNDDGVTLSINDVTVTEGDAAVVSAVFTVTLSAAQSQEVTVSFNTGNQTAVAPGDFAAQGGTLTFAPGETSKQITINVAADTLDEANETFTVTLSSATGGATIVREIGTGTINDNDPTPTVSINDQATTEGDSGTTDMVFTVTLSVASGQTVTVPFSVVGVTATAGTDFETQTGQVVFSAGETTKTITVRVIGDAIDEPVETFVVNLGVPTNATIEDGVGQGTINDDDETVLPTLSIADANVSEGNSGTKDLTFTVTLSAASTTSVTVNFATAPGTATTPSDFTAANGTLTFNAGETTKTITVQIAGDTTNEGDENFTVTLSSASGATIARATAVGTISDDDGAPGLSITGATVTEGNTGTVVAEFTVTLSAVSTQTVTVNFATAGATATSGTDFAAANGTVTFMPGQSTRTIQVTVNGDVIDEGNETFSVTLSQAANATITQGSATGTITDDDPTPTLSIADANTTEGNTGTKVLTFTVTLSAASGLPVSVNFSTTGGTATSGTDFQPATGTLNFAAGVLTQTVSVTINGDTTVEPNENFTVTLATPTNATILDGTATGTITDDDSTPTISIADATVTEGNSGNVMLSFTVTLSAASGQTVTVAFATSDGTATQPGDYTQNTGTVTFNPGETSKTITVTVIGDSLDESNETLTVTLSNPTNATIQDGTATGTITDDDTAGTIQFSTAVFTVGEAGGTATITVTRTGGTAANATVNFATSNGTALAGSDYTTASGTLTFLAGETSKTFTVPILVDSLLESLETVTLRLTSPGGGATLGAQSTATLNITDDDGSANERFVGQLYRDLLGREAEDQGMDFYNDLLQRGQSRGNIAFMIQHSPEYRNKLVGDLYQEILGRAVDPTGLDVHTRFLSRGKTIDELRAVLLASDEFFTRRGGGTNDGFLNALYQNVLGRSVDPTGDAIYSQVLSSGGSRQFVAREVLKSIEADRRLSAGFYTEFLRRTADTAGLDFQANALQREYEPRILAGILASDEYFTRL